MTGDFADLIGRVALGDRKAFAALYNQTSPKLLAICLRILGNRNEAEEVLQEVYIKIWQRAGAFTTGSLTSAAWLAAIARNQSIDAIRARKPVADEVDSMLDLADAGPDPEPDVDPPDQDAEPPGSGIPGPVHPDEPAEGADPG